MDTSQLARLLVPSVLCLVAFLAYTAQYLFESLEPGPLDVQEKTIFNALVLCIYISYARACVTDPGQVPVDWTGSPDERDSTTSAGREAAIPRHRFCRKCQALKAPRSHHCRVCKRCVPRMDHHCPWTANCVSHFTLPHFARFLWYAVAAMTHLEYLLYLRIDALWQHRHLPSYLGPSTPQLIHLFVLIVVNSLTLFLVSITFVRTVWGLGANVTTIESWEIERHEQLIRRARVFGGWLDGPDGVRVKITRQEFPYDIGIWHNIVQGMGTANVLAWFWPLSATPRTSGLKFETNGFEDVGTTWPPPDPDRMPRMKRPTGSDGASAFVHGHGALSPHEELVAFRQRQESDMKLRPEYYSIQRRRPFHARFEPESHVPVVDDHVHADAGGGSGEEGWQDSGGNRLKDYGIDEDVEFYDEDSVPLAALLGRRLGRARANGGQGQGQGHGQVHDDHDGPVSGGA